MTTQTILLASWQKAHTKLMSIYGEDITVTRNTETLDADGQITGVSTTSDTGVNVRISPLSEEDREFLGIGIITTGSQKMITNPSYDLSNLGNSFSFENGDIITTADSVEHMVSKLIRKFSIGDTEVCRTFLIKRVDT